MSKPIKPGNWPGAMVIMDRIPAVCPECGHEVTLRGGISEDGQRFEVTECPHCHTPMDITISTRADSDEEDAEREQANPLKQMEVSVGVKSLVNVSEFLCRMTNFKSVSECLDRVMNTLCTVFATYELSPNAIKDMYIRETLADIYSPEGKRQIITELEAQIEKAEN